MKIFRMTDRIPVKIGDVKVMISPLNYAQRAEVVSQTKNKGKDIVPDTGMMMNLTLKYCIKSVEGLEYFDGSKFELQFDEDGSASQESISELLQMAENEKLITLATKILSSKFEEQTPGLEIDFKNVVSIKKN